MDVTTAYETVARQRAPVAATFEVFERAAAQPPRGVRRKAVRLQNHSADQRTDRGRCATYCCLLWSLVHDGEHDDHEPPWGCSG